MSSQGSSQNNTPIFQCFNFQYLQYNFSKVSTNKSTKSKKMISNVKSIFAQDWIINNNKQQCLHWNKVIFPESLDIRGIFQHQTQLLFTDIYKRRLWLFLTSWTVQQIDYKNKLSIRMLHTPYMLRKQCLQKAG